MPLNVEAPFIAADELLFLCEHVWLSCETTEACSYQDIISLAFAWILKICVLHTFNPNVVL